MFGSKGVPEKINQTLNQNKKVKSTSANRNSKTNIPPPPSSPTKSPQPTLSTVEQQPIKKESHTLPKQLRESILEYLYIESIIFLDILI